MRTRSVAARAAVVVSAASALLTLAQPAQAAANPYTPEGVCGSGYRVVDSRPLEHRTLSNTGGRVYLLYNSSNGYNCAVTIKGVAVGKQTGTEVTLLVRTSGDNSTRYSNGGDFKYYAGPVRARAAGKCVEVFGHTFSTTSSNSYYAIIPWGHCG
ncbi:spore-associated protein A [Streptosporangium saharense]|uniref:spore-associated protein A n=1 Tax=Streptosporangium saharense TaxID=1706840 RepID=UPI0036C6491A